MALAGEREWGEQQAAEIIQALPGSWCWIGGQSGVASRVVAVEKAHTLLGGEWRGLVYDARAGFDPDAFGAVAGTLQAGGLLLLLTPPLSEWPDYPDPQRSRITVYPYSDEQVGRRFLQRVARQLQESGDAYLIEQGLPLPPIPPPVSTAKTRSEDFAECATADQLAAVEALCKVAQGHRRRPLVLVSDRGRGKSTALGLAAARLLQQGIRRIVVSAPRLAAVEQLFEHAAAQFTDAEHSRGVLKLAGGGELLFEPPDRVVHEGVTCDLLLVDEAAAIPVALLEPMLRQHARIAFATTVHGYEGTGRGFELRFRKALDEVTPEWRRLRMEQPIRWAVGDPLERLVFRTLLLDAEAAADQALADIPLGACRIERMDRDTLLDDEALLSQLFGLLILAHYRTTPADLRNLLDGPNLEVTLLRHQQSVVGCALVAYEGGFDAPLAAQITAGERRLRGNLLPQSLANHAGLVAAPQLIAARVMRIAIHPALKRVGLGRRLIEALSAQALEAGSDYLGASFGADAPLLDFWRASGCQPVRVGLKREASSGAHAVMVMRPLSESGWALFRQARRRFVRQWPTLLSEPLAQLEAPLVRRLLQGGEHPMPDTELWGDACAFATTRRDYGNSLLGLSECLLYALSEGGFELEPRERQLAIAKVLQRRPWAELVGLLQLSGRREGVEQLRGVYRKLCVQYR